MNLDHLSNQLAEYHDLAAEGCARFDEWRTNIPPWPFRKEDQIPPDDPRVDAWNESKLRMSEAEKYLYQAHSGAPWLDRDRHQLRAWNAFEAARPGLMAAAKGLDAALQGMLHHVYWFDKETETVKDRWFDPLVEAVARLGRALDGSEERQPIRGKRAQFNRAHGRSSKHPTFLEKLHRDEDITLEFDGKEYIVFYKNPDEHDRVAAFIAEESRKRRRPRAKKAPSGPAK